MELEGILHHDGRDWVLENDSWTVRGATLEALDQRLADRLRGKELGPRQTATVFMTFDNSTIPGWIRQYAQHYFNRRVTING